MALKESVPFLVASALLTLILGWIFPWIAWIPALFFIYTLYFFRDPERIIPSDLESIVSPADGKIISIDEVIEENHITHQKMKRVAIFLNVFNVHVNRIPVAGTVLTSEHKPGQFLDARTPDIDVRNEAQNWLIETLPPHKKEKEKIVVRQIAGLIARRIVAWKKEGDSLEKGERFGMIRFGSRTDVYLPLDCTLLVQPGDIVAGGSTIIATWPTPSQSHE